MFLKNAQNQLLLVLFTAEYKTRDANFFLGPNPHGVGLILTGSPIFSVTFALLIMTELLILFFAFLGKYLFLRIFTDEFVQNVVSLHTYVSVGKK